MDFWTRQAFPPVEISFPLDLVVLQVWHQLVNYILHSPIVADILQRVTLVDHNFTGRAGVIVFQVLDQTALAERVQALGHCGGVN